MWTVANRARYDRSGLPYAGDLTNDKLALVAPPTPLPRRGGYKQTVDLCEVVNSFMDILGTNYQWRAISKDLALHSVAYGYFAWCDWNGTLGRV